MNTTATIFYAFIDLVSPMIIGQLLRRYTKVTEYHLEIMLKWNLIGLGTVLAALSFWNISLSLSLIWLPIIGVMMQAAPGFLGWLQVRKRVANPLEQGSYILSALLSNRGVVGMLTVFLLFGEEGYVSAQLVMLLSTITLYMIYFPIAQAFYLKGSNEMSFRPNLSRILFNMNQLPALGLIAGFILHANEVSRPEWMGHVFPFLVHLSAFLFVLPLGYSLSLEEIRPYWKRLPDLLILKFIATPIATWGMAALFGLDGNTLAIVIMLSMSPTAIQAVVTARLHKLDSNLAMAAFAVTTAVYFALIFPVFILWNALRR